jgi:hypothetical protein
MLTVVYFSVLQHKLVFLLLHGNFTVTFSAGVNKRQDKVVLAELITFTMTQQILKL